MLKFTFLICGLAGFASFGHAQSKIPATIAAFSQTNLSSDRAFRQLAAALNAIPDRPFDVRLLILGELGSDEAHFGALRRGRVQIVGVGYQSISTAVPEFAVVNAPFLFDGWEEMDFVVDNFLTAALDRLLAAKGLHGLRHYGMIWHGVYGRKPLLEPGDVARLRYRALIDSASQLMATELKTDMIQVASTEILTGLQTGLLDGGETNQLVYVMTAIDSQAPHWTATHHTASMLGLIAEKSWWNRLTPEQQAAVEGGYPDRATARAAIRADGMSEIARAAARGAIVHDLPPDARARWRAAVVPTYKRLIEASGDGAQDIFDLIREGQRAYAARANR